MKTRQERIIRAREVGRQKGHIEVVIPTPLWLDAKLKVASSIEENGGGKILEAVCSVGMHRSLEHGRVGTYRLLLGSNEAPVCFVYKSGEFNSVRVCGYVGGHSGKGGDVGVKGVELCMNGSQLESEILQMTRALNRM